MPVFSEDPRSEDPEALRKLRALFREGGGESRPAPTCEDRFGVPSPGGATPPRDAGPPPARRRMLPTG
jgi:hypothetical protein